MAMKLIILILQMQQLVTKIKRVVTKFIQPFYFGVFPHCNLLCAEPAPITLFQVICQKPNLQYDCAKVL